MLKLNSVWSHAAQLEQSYLSKTMDHLSHLLTEIPRNVPHLDSLMFVRHNVNQSQEPPNMPFEPSPIWHDDDTIAADESAKVFLRNMLSKSKGQVRELRVEADRKRGEVNNARRIRENIRQGKDSRSEVDVVRSLFMLQEALHGVDRKRLAAEVETSTIMSVVGDLSVGAQNHNFRSQTFKIPTNCDLCGERIWGLSAKGFDCRDCGYTCHSKCEMKVPAECPGEQSKEDKKKLKTARQEQASTAPGVDSSNGSAPPSLGRRDTMNSLSSGYAASAGRSTSNAASQPSLASPSELPGSAGLAGPGADAPAAPAETKPAPSKRNNRVLAPPPTQYTSAPATNDSSSALSSSSKAAEKKGRMLYEYQANGADEITVHEGDSVVIVEPDGTVAQVSLSSMLIAIDGSGWMQVRSGTQEGLVPAAYVEAAPSSASPGPADRADSTYSSSSTSVAGGAAGKRVGPAVAPRRGAKKLQYVEALYDYDARSGMEFSMVEGDRFVLISRDTGDGWADVERGGVTKSVPANYIQEM